MLLVSLLGCVKPSPPVETGARPADTADSGAGDTADGGTESPCGAWSGVRRVGTQWTVAPTDDYVARFAWNGEGITTVTARDGDIVTLQLIAHYEGADGFFDMDRVETWRCDGDGAWWLRSDVVTEGESFGAVIGSAGSRTFDPGWLVRPSSAEVGSTWTDTFMATTQMEGFDATTEAASCTSTVAEEAVRAVDAGDLTARHISVSCSGVNVDSVWLRETGGFVEDDDLQLVSYRP